MTTASLCSSPAPFSFIWRRRPVSRSEEHTSELQSQSNLVCRLLLEKKNNAPITSTTGTLNDSLHNLRQLGDMRAGDPLANPVLLPRLQPPRGMLGPHAKSDSDGACA